ncbi:MAG: FAD-binding oxidoreductase [Pseudomonadota bacterium]
MGDFTKPGPNLAQLAGELQRSLSGKVLLPGDPGFADQAQIDNGRVQLSPVMIVLVDSVGDVSKTLRFAQRCGLRLTVKGGGHSATGYCLNSGGIVIDFALMNAMRLEGDTLKVQAGARWIDIYNYLQDKGEGLIPIGGGCAPVGVSGFVLGGGYSFASRSYGLSIDNLISLTVVGADGEVRTVSAESTSREDIDLFWACRGGGGGNFGVVVDLHLQLQKPRTPTMLIAQIRYPASHAQDVIGFYNEWVETVPDELACYGIWGPYPDPTDATRLVPAIGFTCVYNGDAAHGVDLLAPLLRRDPMLAQMNNMTLPQFEKMVGRNTLVDGRYAYIRSGEVPPCGLTEKFIDTSAEFMSQAPNSGTFMVWTHAGGKIDAVAADATAFPHRGARFMPEIKSIWPRGDVPQTRANVEWAFDFFEALRPHFSGAYVNYIDPLQPDWKRMYYGGNYDRLLQIKQACDPENVFAFQQGIGSAFEPDVSKPLDLAPLNRTFVE